jgi:hypothetical protein
MTPSQRDRDGSNSQFSVGEGPKRGSGGFLCFLLLFMILCLILILLWLTGVISLVKAVISAHIGFPLLLFGGSIVQEICCKRRRKIRTE